MWPLGLLFQFCAISPYTSIYDGTMCVSTLILHGFFFHFYKWAIQFSPHFQLQMKFEIISQVHLTCICRFDKRKAVGICRNRLEIFSTTSGIHANLLLALTISWDEFFIVLLKLNVTVGF